MKDIGQKFTYSSNICFDPLFPIPFAGNSVKKFASYL